MHPEANLVDVCWVENGGFFFTATPSNFYCWNVNEEGYEVFSKLDEANINSIQLVNGLLVFRNYSGYKKSNI